MVVVGGGLAGVRVLQGLRSGGYDGELVLVGAEDRAPYDRPPLSKQVLRGREVVPLLPPDGLRALGVDVRLGTRAIGLDTAELAVELDDGRRLVADDVVLAVGAIARPLRVPGGEAALTVRTADDALTLRGLLVPGARVVVVGAGFVGCEVASSARALGCEVTLVEPLPTPLHRSLGPVVGERVTALHESAGVAVLSGAPPVVAVEDGTPSAVLLADGTRLGADVVVAAVGAQLDLGWLDGSGVLIDDGVVCDAGGRTSVPGVWAAGDCARWWSPRYGQHLLVEHWTSADRQGSLVASGLLGGAAPERDELPYVWSDQQGLKLQVVGLVDADRDEVHVVGDPARPLRCTAIFTTSGRVSAVVGLGRAPVVERLRPLVDAGAPREDALALAGGAV